MGFLLFLLVAAGSVGYRAFTRQRHQDAWKTVAHDLGLTLTAPSTFSNPELDGTLDGVLVKVSVVHGGGNNRRVLTAYTAAYHCASPPVRFHRQGGFSFVHRLSGRRDVEIGDPRFDDAIVIDAGDATAIRTFLTPGRRAAIHRLFVTFSDTEFTNEWVTVRTVGRESDPRVVARTIGHLVDVCRILRAPELLDDAVAHREDGDMAVAADLLHELNSVDHPNQVIRAQEAEVREVLDMAPPPPPPPAPEPEPVAAAAPVPVSRQEVIDDLFSTTRLSHEVGDVFTEHYAGRPVEWTGELQSTRPFRHDADFGGDPGVKATITIGAIGQSTLFSNQIKAFVDLPAEFDGQRGDEVGFRGTLLRVDPYTRAIFVADATTTP